MGQPVVGAAQRQAARRQQAGKAARPAQRLQDGGHGGHLVVLGQVVGGKGQRRVENGLCVAAGGINVAQNLVDQGAYHGRQRAHETGQVAAAGQQWPARFGHHHPRIAGQGHEGQPVALDQRLKAGVAGQAHLVAGLLQTAPQGYERSHVPLRSRRYQGEMHGWSGIAEIWLPCGRWHRRHLVAGQLGVLSAGH